LCIIIFVPFAKWLTAAKMFVEKLFWCLKTPFFKKVDCEWAFIGFDGVFDTQNAASISGNLGGVGVRNFTSSFEIIDSGSKGTSPAPQKPA
jgi:hypothetical protein